MKLFFFLKLIFFFTFLNVLLLLHTHTHRIGLDTHGTHKQQKSGPLSTHTIEFEEEGEREEKSLKERRERERVNTQKKTIKKTKKGETAQAK